MHALTNYQLAALLLMLTATLAVIGLASAAGYRRGRQAAMNTAAEYYEPLQAATLSAAEAATADALRTRTALEQHQADAAAIIEDLTAERDAAVSINADLWQLKQINTDQRTTLLQAANALQLAARTTAPIAWADLQQVVGLLVDEAVADLRDSNPQLAVRHIEWIACTRGGQRKGKGRKAR